MQVTYALSALEHLVVSSLSDPRHVTRHVKVVYITRDLAPSELFINGLNTVAHGYDGRSGMSISIEVFVTSLGKGENSDTSSDMEKKDVSSGRPDLAEIMKEVLEEGKPETPGVVGGGLLVATCGPAGLIQHVSHERFTERCTSANDDLQVKDTARRVDRALAISA